MTIAEQKTQMGDIVPAEALALAKEDRQRAVPKIAKQPDLVLQIEQAVKTLPTSHRIELGDSRDRLAEVEDESVHLAVTSPPYWNLKEYPERDCQLGHTEDFDRFLGQIEEVWEQLFRVLVPGGRVVIVVGDVCVSRRSYGRHLVFPLHAGIQESCRKIGFDNLAPIIWYKIANAQFEVENGSGFMGKPYEPNAVIKNDIEYILFQRKPGGYRKPSVAARLLSVISAEQHKEWFQQIWTVPGASTRNHPAPYPLEVAERLVRMFSFVGDTVLDPFLGTGTTSLAAASWGRNSIGFDIEPSYVEMAKKRLNDRL